MRILVTGSSGFIGKHVVARLKDCEALWACDSSVCDMSDPQAVSDALRSFLPTHCLHLAWNTRGDYADSAHNLDWLRAGIHLVREFYACGGQRFVGVGTCFEYASTSEPRSEIHTPTLPETRYGKCKLALANFLEAHACCAGRSWAWCRPFYITGPGESLRRLVPSACAALVKGQDFCTAGYARVLDYMDVRDVAGALAKILASRYCGVVNIGAGYGRPVSELLEILAGIAGSGGRILPKTPCEDSKPIVARTEILQKSIMFTPRFGIHETLTACLDDVRSRIYESH